MDRLPLHIEYLLTRHDCVIVPGLGAFIASETEPAVDRTRGVVTPRRREISFNGSVVSDDGLLSHSIARREHMSYEDAHRMLARLADRMHRELAQEGETSVGRVGKLFRNADGRICFRPRLSVVETEINSEVPLRIATSATPEDIATSGTAESTDKRQGNTRRTRKGIVYEDPDRYIFSVSKRVVHAAAVVAFLLTVCLSVLIPYNHDEEQRASVMPIEDFLRRPLVIEVQEDHTQPTAEAPSDTIEKAEVIKIL